MGLFVAIPIYVWVILGMFYGAFVAPAVLSFNSMPLEMLLGSFVGSLSGYLFWHGNFIMDNAIEKSFRKDISKRSNKKILEHYYDDSIWNGREYCLNELIIRNADSYAILPYTIERLLYECDSDGLYPEWARYNLPLHFPEILQLCPHVYGRNRCSEYEQERALLRKLVDETESLRGIVQSNLGSKDSLPDCFELIKDEKSFQEHELGLRIVVLSIVRRYSFSDTDLDSITDVLLDAFMSHEFTRAWSLAIVEVVRTPRTYEKLVSFLDANNSYISNEECETFQRLINILRVWMDEREELVIGQVSLAESTSHAGEVSLSCDS